MAYEDTNPFTGIPQTGAYDAPTPNNNTSSSTSADFVGGGQGAWGGFDDTSDKTNLIGSTSSPMNNNTSSPGKSTGLFAGLEETNTINFSPIASNDTAPDADSEFVSLTNNAGSWNDQPPPPDKEIEDTTQEEKMDVPLTEKERLLEEKKKFLPWGCWTIFDLFNTPFAIHWSFILVLVVNVGYSMFYYELSFYAFAWALVCAMFWFMFVLINQLSHVIAAKLWKVETRVAVLWMFGGLRETIFASTPCEHLKVSLAGPMSHVPWIILFGMAANHIGKQEGGVAICYCVYKPMKKYFGFDVMNHLFLQNLWLLGWNMFLPCYPLDGALILASVLLKRGYAPDRVLAIMMRISGLCFVGSLVWVFFTRHLWAIITAGFLLWNVISMCWYLGRAEKHPLFGLKTQEQIDKDNAQHVAQMTQTAASTVAAHIVDQQVQQVKSSMTSGGAYE